MTEQSVPDDGGGTAQPVALVAAHGDLAFGLVSAVAQITGEGGRFVTMSNKDLGAVEIEARMREIIDGGSLRVVFTDLPAGSCAMAARRVLRDHPDVLLVTGVNLAALLHFATHVGGTVQAAGREAAERAKSAVTVMGAAGGD